MGGGSGCWAKPSASRGHDSEDRPAKLMRSSGRWTFGTSEHDVEGVMRLMGSGEFTPRRVLVVPDLAPVFFQV